MISTYMIIAALVTAAQTQGVVECNATQPGDLECFGIFGQPLVFYLPTNSDTKTRLEKNNEIILKIVNSSFTDINEKYKSRSIIFTNGTFKLNEATKADSGKYKFEEHDSTGVQRRTSCISVKIVVSVSKPAVSQMCLSPEEKAVSCSSEGDEVEFIFSVDDNFLTQPGIKSTGKHNVSNVTFSLHGQLMGTLTCIVQNNVSTEQTAIRLTSCTGIFSDLSVVNVALIASTVTLFLILAVFLGIKHFNKTTDPMTVNFNKTTDPMSVDRDDTEDEVVYSDVRVKQHTRTTTPTSQDAY